MVKYFVSGGDNKLAQVQAFEQLCWVDMVNPTDDEVDDVVEVTGVSEDMIKAALDEEEPARTEFDEGNSMFVVDCPIIEESESGDTYSTLPLAIIYNKKCIITVCLKGNPVLKDFITGRIKVFCDKPVAFILNFMYGNAKRFLYCLKQIDRKAHRVQAELGRTLKNEEILQLLELENSLVYFSTSLNSNYKVHEKLSKVEAVATREDYQDLFDDMVIESSQAIEMCKIYKDILSVSMDAYGSVISNNANDTMKKLTVITILLAIPTMIAGFWGMNVPVPWQIQDGDTSTLWFWVIIIATFILTAAVAFVLVKSMKFRPAAKRRQRRKKRSRDD
ncbi:MAG TPA: magnesium transporter CorA family protein [Candidatus Coproplasma avicola]|uniref:Magnesium transporter CorA family protein n=1 Tax=Candidatus Coproplasma avicola TaxID=2840744 RepID=A0A9D1J9M3_9FIRM|nr:magnesium transporter CorA family protein [Candidatus Coproplasma avicola]